MRGSSMKYILLEVDVEGDERQWPSVPYYFAPDNDGRPDRFPSICSTDPKLAIRFTRLADAMAVVELLRILRVFGSDRFRPVEHIFDE